MEFNFETPLILRLRKIAHSKTVLWCGILFAVMPIFSGWEFISCLMNSNPSLYSLIPMACDLLFFLLPCISFFVVFISAKNKDAVLPTGGFTAAGILCALACVFLILNHNPHIASLDVGKVFYFNVFNSGIPSNVFDFEKVYIKLMGIIAIVVFEVFFVSLSATFFSAASVAKNNKPRKFFAIILAIVSFIVFAFYILNIVMYMANGRISYIIQFFSINPKGAIMLVRSDILNFFLPTAAMFLCGCVGIGFAKASRRIK